PQPVHAAPARDDVDLAHDHRATGFDDLHHVAMASLDFDVRAGLQVAENLVAAAAAEELFVILGPHVGRTFPFGFQAQREIAVLLFRDEVSIAGAIADD